MSKDYIPPSESLQKAIDALDAAWDEINKANVAFSLGIGNDGHHGHKAMASLVDGLEAARSIICREHRHHFLHEDEVRLPDETDTEYLRRTGAWQ